MKMAVCSYAYWVCQRDHELCVECVSMIMSCVLSVSVWSWAVCWVCQCVMSVSCWHRSDATQEDLGDLVKTNNPEEINIDDDEDTDEEETVEGEGSSSSPFSLAGWERNQSFPPFQRCLIIYPDLWVCSTRLLVIHSFQGSLPTTTNSNTSVPLTPLIIPLKISLKKFRGTTNKIIWRIINSHHWSMEPPNIWL